MTKLRSTELVQCLMPQPLSQYLCSNYKCCSFQASSNSLANGVRKQRHVSHDCPVPHPSEPSGIRSFWAFHIDLAPVDIIMQLKGIAKFF